MEEKTSFPQRRVSSTLFSVVAPHRFEAVIICGSNSCCRSLAAEPNHAMMSNKLESNTKKMHIKNHRKKLLNAQWTECEVFILQNLKRSPWKPLVIASYYLHCGMQTAASQFPGGFDESHVIQWCLIENRNVTPLCTRDSCWILCLVMFQEETWTLSV